MDVRIPLMVATSTPVLSIPIEISLSEEGDSFFLRNARRMDAFHLLKGKGKGSHRLAGFNPKLIQTLLTFGFLNKVSTVIDDLLPMRNEVVDMSKLLVYGMSYRQFADDVLQLVLNSEPLKAWNRRNPKQRIDAGNCKGRSFTSFIEKRRDARDAMVKLFLGNALSGFMKGKDPREQQKLVSSGKRFLLALDSFTWFFILSYRSSSGWSDVYNGILKLLVLHLQRISFIEYTALVVVELLQQIELDTMRSSARVLYGSRARTDLLLREEEHVKVLKQHRLDHGGGTHLSCSFERKQSGKGVRNRIKITLAGQASSYRQLNRRVHESLRSSRQGKDLFEYFEDGNELGFLGFNYLSFLRDFCKEWGIRFDSFVNRIEEGDYTVIHIIMDL